MKKSNKSLRIISAALAALLIVTVLPVMLTSCSSGKKIIGIVQFGSHESLNNCYDGIIEGLKSSGINLDEYEIEYLNSNFDSSVSQTQCNQLVNKGAAVIIAIATPSAVAAANAAADSSVPVVYCAVTDSSVMENYKNVTGSSDVPNFEKQLETVTAIMGRTDLKIGVLYSTEESSSPYQVEMLEKAAKAYDGMSVSVRAVADINTIDTQVNALISEKVDCFVNLLDNTIVGKLTSNILPLTDEAGIPVFGSEVEQVKKGCAASASIDYITVGKSAGEAAAAILSGKSADDIPVAVITDPENYINTGVIKKLGLTVPEDFDATDVG